MKQKLINDYLPLANSIAYKKKKTVPNCVTLDELKSAAYMGLIEAASKFDFSKGSSFGNYASIRISGSIKDYLRFLVVPDIHSIVEKKIYNDIDSFSTEDFFDFLSKFLNKNESRIVKMYYIESKTMKEIATSENITESRVSQIISNVHKKLKIKLEGAEK